MNGTIVVSQLGARMHYAVPRIFENLGRLERLNTDICASRGWPRALAMMPRGALPASLRRLAGRIPHGIPPHKIRCFETIGLEAVIRRMLTPTIAVDTEVALEAGRAFSRAVVAEGFGEASAFYGMSGECLEQLHAARGQGLWSAVEQVIAPRSVADRLVAHENERHPGWETAPDEVPLAREYAQREADEWKVADIVVCASEFVRDGIAAAGGPVERCVVVPYGVDATTAPPSLSRPRLPGRLRVLTVGAACLRKGTPDVLTTALRLAKEASFRFVGPIDQLPAVRQRQLAEGVTVTGQVPRSEIPAQYEWADIFFLPSICEGSATVIYEALAAGLPVVTTPNAGSVVRDGIDGFVCAAGDVDALSAAIARLAADPDLVMWMGRNARARAAEFDVAAYGRRLWAAFDPAAPVEPEELRCAV